MFCESFHKNDVLLERTELIIRLHLSKGRMCTPFIRLELAEKIFGSPGALLNQPGKAYDARLVFQCNLIATTLRIADLTSVCEKSLPPVITAWTESIDKELLSIELIQRELTSASGKRLFDYFYAVLTDLQ